jgi:hypothetical protein
MLDRSLRCQSKDEVLIAERIPPALEILAEAFDWDGRSLFFADD